MTAMTAWYDGNTMLVELGTAPFPLADQLTGDVIDDADVTCRGLDADGNELAGAAWPMAVPAVSGGLYRVAISYAVELGIGALGTMEIIADKDGNRAYWQIPIIGRKRER